MSGFFAPQQALAAASVTPASNGANISIDKTSAAGGTGTFTALSGPGITEIIAGDIAGGIHTITLPAGWEFDAGTINVFPIGGNIGLESTSIVLTLGQTSFSFNVTSVSTAPSQLGVFGLKVRPAGTAVSSGNITMTAGTIAGVNSEVTPTNFGTLSTVASTPESLKIETLADGNGTEIDTDTVQSGTTLTVYSNTRDHFGNFVENVAATWSLVTPTGVVEGDLVASGDTKSAVLTGNLVGTTVIQAVGSFTDTTGVITVVPGSVSAGISTVAADTETKVVSSGGEIITVTVTAKDAAGNLISGKTASIASSGTGNTISPASASTGSNGVATFTISSTKAESKTITATVDGVPITSSTPTVIFTHDVASQLAIATQPSTTATAGVAFIRQPVINVLDQFGNLVSDDDTTVITAARNSGTGTGDLQGTLTATVSDGVASFVGLNYREAVTISIDFSSGSLTPVTSDSIAVSPNVPATATLTQQPSSTGTVDASLSAQPIVRVVDAYGNNVADGTSVVLSLASGTDGALRGTLTRMTTSGTATFNDIGYNKVDEFSITATAGAAVVTSDPVGPLSAGIIDGFTLFAVSPQVAGTPFSVSVSNAIDQYSNPASGTVAVSASTGGGNSPSGATPAYETINVTNGSGAANTTLVKVIDTVLRGTVGSITSDTGTITVSPAIASQVVLTAVPGTINASTDGENHSPISSVITGQLKDQYGNENRTNGVGVVITTSKGAVTLTDFTDTNGRVSSTLTSGGIITAGVANISATTDLTVVPTTVTFNDVTAPDAPSITGSASIVINIANKLGQVLSGTAEEGSTVTIYVDGNVGVTPVTTTANGNGDFAFTNAELQTAGIVSGTDYSSAKSVTVKATDAANNISNESSAVSYTQDTVAPSVSSYTLNGSGQNVVFNPGSVSIVVTASEPVDWVSARIYKSDNPTVYKEKFPAGDGTVTGTFTDWTGDSSAGTPAPDGQYAIKVHITDLAGNDVNNLVLAPYTITVDTIAPTVALTYSTNPAKAGTETITATYSEPIVGTPQISIDQPGSTDISPVNMSATGDSKVWTYDYTVNAADGGAYVDGTATVSLSATADAAGNASAAPTNTTFTIDTAAPTATITSPTADIVVKDADGDVGLEFVSTGGSVCEYKVDGGNYTALADCTSPKTITLTDGRKSVVLRVTDTAGNSTESSAVSFVVDTNDTLTVGATGADFTGIQTAIDKATAGDIVSVAAGTYTETVSINKSVTMRGAKSGVNPNDGSWNDTRTDAANESIIHGVVNLSLKNIITLDGFTLERTETNEGHILIGSDLPSGAETMSQFTIQNNRIIGSRTSATAWGGIHTNLLDNYPPGPYSDPGKSATIQNNRIDISGSGSSNGINIRYLVPGTNNNSSLSITGNYIGAINPIPGDGINLVAVQTSTGLAQITGNYLVGSNIALYRTVGVNIADNQLISPPEDGIWVMGGDDNVTIDGNTITGGTASAIRVDNISTRTNSGVTITNNTLQGSAYGVYVALNSVTDTVEVHTNAITGNTTNGVFNDPDSGGSVDATQNWWGNISGPLNATSNPNGSGNAVSDNVTFAPWYLDATLTGLDSTAPTASLTDTPAALTNATTADITVGGDGVIYYKYKLDAGAYGAETAVASRISLSGLSSGSHTVSVIGRDQSGNWQSSATSFTWTVDTSVPTLSTVTIASNNANTALAKVGDIVTVTFVASENLTSKPTVTIATHVIDAGNVVQGGNATQWTATYTMVGGDATGVVPFTINFSDIAGNPGSEVNQNVEGAGSVTFDKTLPIISIDSPYADSRVNGDAVIEFTNDSDSTSTVAECSVDNSTWVTCTSGTTTLGDVTGFGALTDGNVTLYLRDTDAAGNTGTTQVVVVKDTSVPSIISKTPGASAVGIDPTSNITVVFNEDVVITDAQVTVKKGSSPAVSTAVSFVSGTEAATIDPSVTLDNNSTYTVTLTGVTDTVGNALPTTSWVFTTSASYSIALTTGWNLISLPVVPTDTQASAVLGTTLNDAAKIETVWKYDPVAGTWGAYHPGSPGTSNFSTMTAGEGYWINYLSSGAGTVAGTGNLFQEGNSTPPQKTLAAGWNLIGYYQLENVTNTTATKALSTVAGQWTQLRTYNNTDKQFQAVIGSNYMKPGEGYWIFMKSSSYAPYLYGPGDTD